MEPEGSLPCSQQPATCSHPEARRIPFVPFQSHCNIILPSITRSSKWCRLITLPHQNPVLSFAPIRTTCPANHRYHLVTSTLHTAPHYAPLSSLAGTNTPHAALSPNATPNPCFKFICSCYCSPLLCEALDGPSSGYGRRRRRFLASNADTHLSQHPAPHATAPSH